MCTTVQPAQFENEVIPSEILKGHNLHQHGWDFQLTQLYLNIRQGRIHKHQSIRFGCLYEKQSRLVLDFGTEGVSERISIYYFHLKISTWRFSIWSDLHSTTKEFSVADAQSCNLRIYFPLAPIDLKSIMFNSHAIALYSQFMKNY